MRKTSRMYARRIGARCSGPSEPSTAAGPSIRGHRSMVASSTPASESHSKYDAASTRLLCVRARIVRCALEKSRDAQERVDDGRVEMCALTADDELDGVVVRQALAIQRPGANGIVHVDERHDPARDRNRRAAQALRVSGSVPTLVMRIYDVLRHLERGIVAHADARFGLEDDVPAESGMFPHFRELLWGQRPRLVEDVIGNAHLPDVVQRRQAREQIDPFAREIGAEIRL